jgi:hypothetical protein
LLSGDPKNEQNKRFPYGRQIPREGQPSEKRPPRLSYFFLWLSELRDRDDIPLFFLFFILFYLFALGGSPHTTSHFPPDLILYVNLVAMGPVHLSPVTWPQALRYWYSKTSLMHIVAQLCPIDLHNFLGQIPESSQFLGASKLPLLE